MLIVPGGSTDPFRSWEIVYQGLSNLDLARQSSSLPNIFSPEAVQSLSRPFANPLPPSTQTRAAFDKWFTSSSIPPESQASVNQIKEDALWLSQQTKQDEYTALSIVVLEWQNSPASRILQGYTTEETISLQKATNTTDFGASLVSKQGDVNEVGNMFDLPAKRRVRVLETYLSQRQYILDVATLVAASSMHAPSEPEGRSYGSGKQKEEVEVPWLSAIAVSIEEAREALKADETGVAAMIAAVEARLRGLESGSGLVVDADDISAFEDAFRQNQLAEIVRILQLLLINVSVVGSPLPAKEVGAWFEFVNRYGFFERLQLVSSSSYRLVVYAS
jgi:nuclear pore complex protein Nup188